MKLTAIPAIRLFQAMMAGALSAASYTNTASHRCRIPGKKGHAGDKVARMAADHRIGVSAGRRAP